MKKKFKKTMKNSWKIFTLLHLNLHTQLGTASFMRALRFLLFPTLDFVSSLMHISSWSWVQQISNGFQVWLENLKWRLKKVYLSWLFFDLLSILNKNFFPISHSDHFLDDVFKTLNFHAVITEEHKKHLVKFYLTCNAATWVSGQDAAW